MDTDPRDDKELAATGKMSFLDHLDELRRRIIVAVAAVGISFVVCWIFHERIFEFLSVPITQHLGDRKLTYLSPTEPFMIYMKASLLCRDLSGLPGRPVAGLAVHCSRALFPGKAVRHTLPAVLQHSLCSGGGSSPTRSAFP